MVGWSVLLGWWSGIDGGLVHFPGVVEWCLDEGRRVDEMVGSG